MAGWPQPDGIGAGNNSFLWKRNKVGSPQTDSILSNETAVEKPKRNKYMDWGFGELKSFVPKSCMRWWHQRRWNHLLKPSVIARCEGHKWGGSGGKLVLIRYKAWNNPILNLPAALMKQESTCSILMASPTPYWWQGRLLWLPHHENQDTE